MEGFDEKEWKALKAKAEDVRAKASAQQHKAADPQTSVFVSAHAGSGKTYLLVNRVIRLLLDGARPERILCLTYTKAAATEMRTRIFDRLAGWIDLDDDALQERIHGQLDHRGFPRSMLARARRLFARALETPGGLRVMTIHAFCERVLQAFPVEAGMPPGFEVLDEAEARVLLEEARLRLLLPGAEEAAEEEGVRAHLARLAALVNESQLQDLLSELMRFRRLLAWMADDAQRKAEVKDALRRVLGVNEEPLDADAWRERWFAGLSAREVLAFRRQLETAMAALEASGAKSKRPKPTDYTVLEHLKALADSVSAGDAERAWDVVRGWLLTKEGRPNSRGLVTKVVQDAAPEIYRWLQGEQERLVKTFEGYKARRMLAANESLLEAGCAILSLYEKEKSWRGKFDYDDLVVRTLELLESVNGQWVLYRLDGGIDHILLDEAQDTSPEQWMILEKLTEEFFAGEGVERPQQRTIFAVGDVKQSIYSFQGAAPEEFLRMRDFFQRRVRDVEGAFREVPMNVSFRSVQQVLDVVDEVLEQDDFRLGEKNIPKHASARPHVPGFVELWPLEEADTPDDDAGNDGKDKIAAAVEKLWRAPETLEAARDARLKLARRIAATIRRWLDTGEALAPDAEERERRGWPAVAEPDKAPRPIRPRDILILVRQRTTLMDAIVSALKQFNIPVAGVDRLKVSEHIAVQDLLSLGRFLLLPADDLSLAEVLKSPLLERDDGRPFDDDDLLRLRGELFDFSAPLENIPKVNEARPLWEQLRAAAEAGAPVRRAVERLRQWQGLAGYLPPYELFATVLWRDGGMRRFITRLSHEAVEPLEAFLDLAMQYERDELPSLPGFLEWMQAEAPEIAREQEGAADMAGDGEVRVMTVHGAKGLEAPVVFLADTVDTPGEKHLDIVEAPWPAETVEERLPLWVMRQQDRCEVVQDLVKNTKKAAEEEYNRLLYVAMTRAADRLYVCGALTRRSGQKRDGDGKQGAEGKKKGETQRIVNWYERVARVLRKDEYAITAEDGRTVWRHPAGAPTFRAERVAEEEVAVAVLDWVHTPAPAEPGPALWLTPSRLAAPGLDEAQEGALTVPVPDDRSLSPLSTARLVNDPLRDPFRRGVLIHKLLQYLPDVPEEEREARALSWLMMPAQGLHEEQARALWAEVAAVLADERFAPLFGSRSQAEAPFAARLSGADGREMLVSGQIDRLAVLDDEVVVADFKTARPVPERLEDVPESYVRQLALYRLAMADIWPEKTVRAALLFTAGPTWLEIPEAMLQEAMRAFQL